MKPFSRSIIELFDGKKRYLIPLFQRQYVWREDPQLERIWEDIMSRFDKNGTPGSTVPHFLGAIVLSGVQTYGKQVQAWDVIDGQQRLTTFQILLCALRDIAVEAGSEYAGELLKHIVNDGVMDSPVERYKVWPTQSDRPQMKAMIDGVPNGAQVEGAMTAAKVYFLDRMRELIGDESHGMGARETVERVFHTLRHDLALVSIELEGGDDPQVIFETLNGLGQPLLPTDLMRNYIFQRAYREWSANTAAANATMLDTASLDLGATPEKLYDEYWLPFDSGFWAQEERQGRLNRPRVDNFFMHFLAMKKASDVNAMKLFHEYKRWIETDDPYPNVRELLMDASAFAAIYRELVEPTEGSRFARFSKALKVFDVTTVIPLILFLAGEAELPGGKLDACLRILESFLVRRAVCGLTTKGYNQIFVKLVGQIRKGGDPVETLVAALSKPEKKSASSTWPDDSMFADNWMNRAIYLGMTSPRIQFVFWSLELAMRSAKSEDFAVKSEMTVEHIMPVEWKEHWRLPSAQMKNGIGRGISLLINGAGEAEFRDRIIHTMGNLTLVTQSLNSSVGNAKWADKRAGILSHSALAISRELSNIEDWDENAIAARGEKLLGYAKAIWGPPLPKAAQP